MDVVESLNTPRVAPAMQSLGDISSKAVPPVVQFEMQADGVCGSVSARRRRTTRLVRWDLLAISCAAGLSFLLYGIVLALFAEHSPFTAMEALTRTNLVAMFVVPMCVVIAGSYANGHYTRFKPFWAEIVELIKTVAIAIAIGAFILFAFNEHFSRIWFFSFWVFVLVLIPPTRLLCKRSLMHHGVWYRPMLVVGAGENARAAQVALESDPFIGMRVVGFVSSHLRISREVDEDMLMAEVVKAATRLEKKYGEFDVLYAPDDSSEYKLFSQMLDGPLSRVRSVTLAPPAHGLPLFGATYTSVLSHDTILLPLNTNLGTRWKHFVKRSFDVSASLALLALLSPLFAIVALALRREGASVLYGSRRMGRGGQHFYCYKFRSMVPDADAVLEKHLLHNEKARDEWSQFFKLTDDPRTTSIGRFLRRTSLDELPQLINVVRGNMSLVGPRPILPEEASTYGSQLKLYQLTRPGMTGLWQVSGRSSLTQERRVQLNVWYARNWSLWIDIVILLKTIPALTRGTGAT